MGHPPRYYNPTFGRFISQDPKGFNAKTTNLYSYSFENPIQFRDPFGLDPWPQGPYGFPYIKPNRPPDSPPPTNQDYINAISQEAALFPSLCDVGAYGYATSDGIGPILEYSAEGGLSGGVVIEGELHTPVVTGGGGVIQNSDGTVTPIVFGGVSGEVVHGGAVIFGPNGAGTYVEGDLFGIVSVGGGVYGEFKWGPCAHKSARGKP